MSEQQQYAETDSLLQATTPHEQYNAEAQAAEEGETLPQSATADTDSLVTPDDDGNGIGSIGDGEAEGFFPEMIETISEGLETITGNITEGLETFFEGLGNIAEAADEAILDETLEDDGMSTTVAGTLVEELHEVDDGDMYFMDMALTRSMSILPSEMQNLGELAEKYIHPERAEEEPAKEMEKIVEVEKPPFVAVSTPISVYMLLMSAVISLSSIGPFLQYQGDVSSTMKTVWRQFATSLLLLPLAGVSYHYEGFPKLTASQWMLFAATSISYSTMLVAYAMALEYTSVGNATILANSQVLLLLAGKFLVGNSVSLIEGAGAIVAFSGAGLCSKDSMETSFGDDLAQGPKTIFGDSLSLVSALGGVVYLTLAKVVRPHVSLYMFMFLIMFRGCLFTFLFLLLLGEPASLNFDRSHGFFGWLLFESDRLPLELGIVLICNVLGALGYIRAMQFFDNVVISVAGLLEPVGAELVAFILGVGILPTWIGWTGNLLVILGTLLVLLPTLHSTDKSHGMH
jgi:drug/metabolite transporter (DMT)-like permease